MQYSRPSVPPPGHESQGTRGYPPQQQQPPQYYQQPPQQQYYQPQQQPQYYQQQQQPQPQPVYVQQQAPQRGNEDCLTGCLAGLCICCTLDMLM
ncbi:hypothetical protein NCAS_0I01900 [Naumovozyma castellii]|uniref:Cysteine-rich transmembrane domain-containing protein n=1 Tax=Naumovozyma castellii TaxID=27288 RepID=G0VK24_NAUCA|nr:hypothetical protein NCAS_0I01900 [Naumovozyma castellii CBS 4309]CCC71858.1 hypothetical protein NCAS_0I01900 [Naumovozyma castellii CBS 4309]